MFNVLSLSYQYLKTMIRHIQQYLKIEEVPPLNSPTQDSLETQKMSSLRGLIRDYLETENVSSLNELFRNAQLTTVDLSFWGINAQQAKILGRSLQGTQVHTVNVAGNNLGAQGVKDLAETLRGTQVRDLNVAYNNIGPPGAKDVGIALQGTQVYALNVANNNIGPQGAKDLGLTLKRTQINVLDASCNSLHYYGAIVLVLTLRDTQVHTLSLRGNNIGKRLADEPQDMQLRHFNLARGGARQLGEALQRTLVHTLDVGHNFIDDLERLARQLKDTHVHTLNVDCNNIQLHNLDYEIGKEEKKRQKDLEDKEAKDLAEALEGSNVTRVLGINHPELTKALQKNLEDKKGRPSALAQVVSRTMLVEEIGLDILSYSHEAYVSGQSKTTSLTFKEGGSLAHTLFGNVLERLSNKKDLAITHALQP
ncbi:hypothetical protein [Legionella rowbothamii]|uniref:hypothetical protein n=1 Tax=Legionella rowbothamii TaxID=96229 RepID=UPI0010564C35|nr:hypothetical protein [Legionella rowbothamii]